MNGIIVQAKDVLPFASYLEAHQDRRPPDHLVVSKQATHEQLHKARANNKLYAVRECGSTVRQFPGPGNAVRI